MTISERMGFPPFLEVIFGHPLWLTIIACWLVTPGLMIVIGIIGESRLIPLSPKRQFVSFHPGDLLLGLGMASVIKAAEWLPEEMRWYSTPAFHLLVLTGAVVVAALLTRMEYVGGIYPPRAIISPTKLYHNVVLYVGYGYLGAIGLVACLASGIIWEHALVGLALLGGIGFVSWLGLLVYESAFIKKDALTEKARHAHVDSWRPIWSHLMAGL